VPCRAKTHNKSLVPTRNGEPTLLVAQRRRFLNNSIQNNTRVLRWLWRKQFEELDDQEIVASAIIVRALLALLSVNFAALLLLFFGLGAAFHA
jgi:hypothetical protein